MSGSINKVIIVGNLGRDPEVRHTTEGSKIVTLSIATSEAWKDKITGERKDKTEWHRTVIFNEKIAEIAEKYLHKGSKVYIEGQLQTRKWTDQSGQEHYSTEIILSRYKGELTLLDGKKEGAEHQLGTVSNGSNTEYSYNQVEQGRSSYPQSPAPLSSQLNDDIPF